MKLISYITFSSLLAISSCSMMNKSCCAKKEPVTCVKENCDKPCYDKDKKCNDGSCKTNESCQKDEKKSDCKEEHCKKK